MVHPKFECKIGKDGKYYFNLTSKNGQVVLTSQGYASRSALYNGIESIKKTTVGKGNFEILDSVSGSPYFVVKAANGRVIGRSEVYNSQESLKNGINSVAVNAPVAEPEWME
jgi:hypothetical protein